MIHLKCIECNATFEAKRKDTQYCKSCKKKRRSYQVMMSRKKKHPEIEIGVGSGNSKINTPGPTNKAWKTGIQAYRKLIKKDKCNYCGSIKNLVIHHIDENRHNNELNNLQVLCKSCHQKYHVKRCAHTGQFLAK